MRKITTLVAALLMAVATFAQAPQGFSYQAVVRDAQNAIVANQTVEVTVTILQGASADAAQAVFSEKHSAKTNANGLFTITVGSVDNAEFAKIDWGKGNNFLKTESAYGESTTQLMSVPYALYAEKAASIDAAQLAQTLNSNDVKAILNLGATTIVNNALAEANYATTANVNTTVNNALASYTTNQKLNDTLAVYAKIEDLPEGVNLTGYAKTADLADVATSGSYNDLTNKPTIPTVPTNVSAFTNDANYLVASDITGKADKSEMSITAGTGTATIQLKSGTSATVLTQHQSLSNYATVAALTQQIQALQNQINQLQNSIPTQIGDLAQTATVTVRVNYKTSSTYPATYNNSNYAWVYINNGSEKITGTKTYTLSLNDDLKIQGDVEYPVSGYQSYEGKYYVKINGENINTNGNSSITNPSTISHSSLFKNGNCVIDIDIEYKPTGPTM